MNDCTIGNTSIPNSKISGTIQIGSCSCQEATCHLGDFSNTAFLNPAFPSTSLSMTRRETSSWGDGYIVANAFLWDAITQIQVSSTVYVDIINYSALYNQMCTVIADNIGGSSSFQKIENTAIVYDDVLGCCSKYVQPTGISNNYI